MSTSSAAASLALVRPSGLRLGIAGCRKCESLDMPAFIEGDFSYHQRVAPEICARCWNEFCRYDERHRRREMGQLRLWRDKRRWWRAHYLEWLAFAVADYVWLRRRDEMRRLKLRRLRARATT